MRSPSSVGSSGSAYWVWPAGRRTGSDESAEHPRSAVSTDDGGYEAPPPPRVIREPASTWGPDATGEARGGMVEAEEEFEADD
jgi:hypothetical protein